MTDNEQALASPLGADILTSALVEVMGDADARDAQRLLNALAARGATVASTPPVGETSALVEKLTAMANGLRGSMWANRNEIIGLLDDAAAALRKPAEPVSCEHEWRYTGTDYHGSHKGEDSYDCKKCRAWKYELDGEVTALVEPKPPEPDGDEVRGCPDCNGAGDDGHGHVCYLCDGQGGVTPYRRAALSVAEPLIRADERERGRD